MPPRPVRPGGPGGPGRPPQDEGFGDPDPVAQMLGDLRASLAGMDGSPLALGGAALGLVLLAVLAVLSLGAVPPLHYGIRCNSFNKYADTVNVYGPGRHFIGPWCGFLLFPASVQTVEFTSDQRLDHAGMRYPSLHTRTKEGLALHLDVSLQYRLIKDKVGSLYEEFNVDYRSFFISTIRDTLIKAAAEYEGYQLWTNRSEVGNSMQQMVNDALLHTYAECWGLQLMVIDLPVEYDQAIVATQVQRQNVTTMQFLQLASKIRAETQAIAAEFDRRVKVIRAHGVANYTRVTKRAKASARTNTLDVEADVLDSIKERLRLSAEDMVEYQHLSAVQLLPNASILYGFGDLTTQVLMQPRAPLNVGSPGGMRALAGHAAWDAHAPAKPGRRLVGVDDLPQAYSDEL